MYKSGLGGANFSGLGTASPDILRFYNFRERRDNRRTSLDSSGSRLYTVNGASNDVSAVDLKSRKELRRFKVGDGPWGGIVIVAQEGWLGHESTTKLTAGAVSP
jgi:YVTN family beta-propeller protein